METNPRTHSVVPRHATDEVTVPRDASRRRKSPDTGYERWPVVCQICGGSASRMTLLRPAQWLNRLVPVRRFGCDSKRCGWQGHLFG